MVAHPPPKGGALESPPGAMAIDRLVIGIPAVNPPAESCMPAGAAISAREYQRLTWVHEVVMASATGESTSSGRPLGVGEQEAELLLGALARVKARRFGRLVVTVNDGRVVDVEVIEKIDREVLRALAM